ncbi:MAG: glycosyltransferase family 61 protein [Blastocatellia bacterium]|nr:glycosyltransferase family 61 protein [Blastocatellia bacterium]
MSDTLTNANVTATLRVDGERPKTNLDLSTPYRILLQERALLLLAGKAVKRLVNLSKRWIVGAQGAIARAYYSLPALSAYNLRRNVVRFKEQCIVVDTFPGSETFTQDWYLKIRGAEVIRRTTPTGLHTLDVQRFWKHVPQHNQGEVFHIPEVFLASVNRARIYSKDFLVLSADRTRLYEESALSRQDVLEANGVFNKMMWHSPKQMSGEYCLLACPWASNNYSEWLLGNLPRLAVIEQFAQMSSLPLIVPPDPRRRESLLRAGVAPERLVDFDNGYWQVDRLYFPQLPSPLANPSPHAVSWLRQTFLDQRSAVPTKRGRRLYVTRRDAQGRRVLNEEEIVSFLQSTGFEVVCPGDLTFADQIELFCEACVVVGPHGAAFANMVFAPATATLVELFGDTYLNGCYWGLASILGQKHTFLTGPSHWRNRLDYSISLNDLKALLGKVGVL